MIKCKKCGKWFSTIKGLNIHSSRMHKKQDANNNSQITEILNRLRKLELDNVYLKSRVKNTTINHSKAEAIERLKQEAKRPEQKINTVNMNNIVKNLKKVFNSGKPLLQKNFRFNDNELGIVITNQLQVIEVM